MDYNNLSDLYKQCKILTIRSLYKLEIGKLCYKALFSNKYSNLNEYFRSHCWTHSYNTRAIYQYRTPKVKTVCESRNIVNKSIQTWNLIPTDIKNSVSLSSFRMRFSNYLLTQQYD